VVVTCPACGAGLAVDVTLLDESQRLDALTNHGREAWAKALDEALLREARHDGEDGDI
jgi:hypothetical protein